MRESTSALPAVLDAKSTSVHGLALVLFSTVLFAPMMGRGFVLDDFGHVFVASLDPFRFGLTGATGGPFYAPVTYLTFKLDWLSAGARPYAWAATNLAIHVGNVLLLYALAWRLWPSQRAAWWAALGFSILHPANAHNVMFIGARAHLVATGFSLGAMLATTFFVRARGFRPSAAAGVILLATAAIFAKESGVMVIAAIAVVALFEDRCGRRRASMLDLLTVGVALGAVLLLYFHIRSRSGAIAIDFSGTTSYRFLLSPAVLAGNLLWYASRTYGLLIPLTLALLASVDWRQPMARRPLATRDVLFSAALFSAAVAPFLPIGKRPDSYSYMPGVAAALLLASIARSLPRGRPGIASTLPIVMVVCMHAALAVSYSQRWLQLARTNSSVLTQIRERHPRLPPGTMVTLLYDEPDELHRFPEGFDDWCFRWAIRVTYGERTVDGRIVRRGEDSPLDEAPAEVRFSYAGTEDGPTVTEIAREAAWR